MTTTFHVGRTRFDWHELDRPADPSATDGWAHHDTAVLHDGTLVHSMAHGRELVLSGPSGRDRIPTDLAELHGITVAGGPTDPRLWICDNGHKFVPGRPDYAERITGGRVVEIDLAGTVHSELTQPPGGSGGWMPTAVAVDEQGDGRIWVADGYGTSLLHRFAPNGTHVATVDGADSGLAFSTPHAIMIDRRRGVPELYVADRGNRRIVVLDLDGRYLRTVGAGYLTSPSGLAVADDRLYVTELFGSLAVLDGADTLLATMGNCGVQGRPGWPNALDGGDTVSPERLAGCFNSPHGVTTDAAGAVYVSEWLIGGRLVRLTPA